MHHKISVDDTFIKNIDLHSNSLKDTINAALTTADQDKATTDINYIKNLINRLVPENIGSQGKNVLLLFILHGYSEQNDTQLVANEVKGFFTTSCLTLLNDLDFVGIYCSRTLRNLFNEMLLNYLKVCNELKTARLYEAFLKFKQQISNSNLHFFQLHVIKQLFHNNDYHKIDYLIAKYEIDNFTGLVDRNLIQCHLFSYFHQLSYASIVSGSYEKAYEILHISLDLNLFVDIPEFQLVLSEYIFVSLVLNKSAKTTDITVYKFKAKLFPRLLKVYQSYQAHDLESFVLNFYLYIHRLDQNDQKFLSRLFNRESLAKLSHQMIDNKLHFLDGKFSEEFMLVQQNSINDLINEINGKLTDYGFQLPEYKLGNQKVTRSSDHQILLRDCQGLASLSGSIADLMF